MKKLFFLFFIIINTTLAQKFGIFALGTKGGGGGDAHAAEIEYTKSLIQEALFEITELFNKKEVQKAFPKVDVSELKKRIHYLNLEVKPEAVRDKYKIERTCVNYSEYNLIECNIFKFRAVLNRETLITLIFHEVLGLMGLEENNPNKKHLSYISSNKLISYYKKYYKSDYQTFTSLSKKKKTIREEFKSAKKLSSLVQEIPDAKVYQCKKYDIDNYKETQNSLSIGIGKTSNNEVFFQKHKEYILDLQKKDEDLFSFRTKRESYIGIHENPFPGRGYYQRDVEVYFNLNIIHTIRAKDINHLIIEESEYFEQDYFTIKSEPKLYSQIPAIANHTKKQTIRAYYRCSAVGFKGRSNGRRSYHLR